MSTYSQLVKQKQPLALANIARVTTKIIAVSSFTPIALSSRKPFQPLTIKADSVEETATGPVAGYSGYRAKNAANATKTDTPQAYPWATPVVWRWALERSGA